MDYISLFNLLNEWMTPAEETRLQKEVALRRAGMEFGLFKEPHTIVPLGELDIDQMPIIPVPTEIQTVLDELGFTVKSYRAGTAFKADKPNNIFKIGSILQKANKPELVTLFSGRTKVQAKNVAGQMIWLNTPTAKEKYYMVITHEPADVLMMTTDKKWHSQSCMEIRRGAYRETPWCEVRYGGMVAYLIGETYMKLKNEKNWLEYSTSRIAIKRFESEKTEGYMFKSEHRVYGDSGLAKIMNFDEMLIKELEKSNDTTYDENGGSYYMANKEIASSSYSDSYRTGSEYHAGNVGAQYYFKNRYDLATMSDDETSMDYGRDDYEEEEEEWEPDFNDSGDIERYWRESNEDFATAMTIVREASERALSQVEDDILHKILSLIIEDDISNYDEIRSVFLAMSPDGKNRAKRNILSELYEYNGVEDNLKELIDRDVIRPYDIIANLDCVNTFDDDIAIAIELATNEDTDRSVSLKDESIQRDMADNFILYGNIGYLDYVLENNIIDIHTFYKMNHSLINRIHKLDNESSRILRRLVGILRRSNNEDEEFKKFKTELSGESDVLKMLISAYDKFGAELFGNYVKLHELSYRLSTINGAERQFIYDAIDLGAISVDNSLLINASYVHDDDLIKKILESDYIRLDIHNIRRLAKVTTNTEIIDMLFDKYGDIIKQINKSGDSENILSLATVENTYFMKKLIDSGAVDEESIKEYVIALFKSKDFSDLEFLMTLVKEHNLEDYIKQYNEKNPGNAFISFYSGTGERDRNKLIRKYPSDIAYATYIGHPLAVKYLIEKGVSKKELSQAMFYIDLNAPFMKKEEILTLLLNAGADINYKYSENNEYIVLPGMTLLMMYGNVNDQSIIKYLLDAGADPTIENDNGDTAYDIAVKNGYRTVSMLKQAMENYK